jgi:hypothetical protein
LSIEGFFFGGATYVDGRYIPISGRGIPITHQRYRGSDVIYNVVSGDGRIMGNDWAGPISTRIPEAFWAKRAGGGRATPVDYDAHS